MFLIPTVGDLVLIVSAWIIQRSIWIGLSSVPLKPFDDSSRIIRVFSSLGRRIWGNFQLNLTSEPCGVKRERKVREKLLEKCARERTSKIYVTDTPRNVFIYRLRCAHGENFTTMSPMRERSSSNLSIVNLLFRAATPSQSGSLGMFSALLLFGEINFIIPLVLILRACLWKSPSRVDRH